MESRLESMGSLKVREFEETILILARRSPLPAEVKRLAVRDVERKLMEAATAEIEAQMKEREEKEAQQTGKGTGRKEGTERAETEHGRERVE